MAQHSIMNHKGKFLENYLHDSTKKEEPKKETKEEKKEEKNEEKEEEKKEEKKEPPKKKKFNPFVFIKGGEFLIKN